MRIAVLGTGMVGRALAGRLAGLGHDVRMGTRDVAASADRPADASGAPALAEWLEAHPGVRLVSFGEAAADADLVVNATSGGVSLQVLDLVGADQLAGRVLLDIANPLDFSAGFPPTLFVKDDDSLAETIQRAYPDARVVKSLNTMNASLMVDPRSLADGAHSVFVSGNDAAAKALVIDLLRSFGWTDIIDLGDLSTARGTEMLLPIWLRLMGTLGTAHFNLSVVR